MKIKKIAIKNSSLIQLSQMVRKLSKSKTNVNNFSPSRFQLQKYNYFVNLGQKVNIQYLEYLKNLRLLVKIARKMKSKFTLQRYIVLEYMYYRKELKKYMKNIRNQKIKDAVNSKARKLNDRRFIYMRKHIKFPKRLATKPYQQSNYIQKSQPVLPWILQGRKQYKKLKNTLSCLFYQLSYNINANKISILTRKQKKLVKQFRKKRKFSKFGRYGICSKSFNKSFKKFNPNKFNFVKKNKIKRQQIYLQHKRLSMINNIDVFSHKYIYMLIMIWYILTNVFLFEKITLFKYEIWLNYYLRNTWIKQAQFTQNNLYLNYVTISGLKSTPQCIGLYKPLFNQLNYSLIPYKNYQRLLINISNKKKINNKSMFKLKRKSKIRHFFKISPKLKDNNKFINFFSNNKSINKKKMSKRLSPKEWLLVNKFTRKKYQDSFYNVFSQLKNVKKIQKYIDKQSQVWHQPYLITQPYYYTTRYNTFIYELSKEQLD